MLTADEINAAVLARAHATLELTQRPWDDPEKLLIGYELGAGGKSPLVRDPGGPSRHEDPTKRAWRNTPRTWPTCGQPKGAPPLLARWLDCSGGVCFWNALPRRLPGGKYLNTTAMVTDALKPGGLFTVVARDEVRPGHTVAYPWENGWPGHTAIVAETRYRDGRLVGIDIIDCHGQHRGQTLLEAVELHDGTYFLEHAGVTFFRLDDQYDSVDPVLAAA